MSIRQGAKIFTYLAFAYAMPSQADASSGGVASQGATLSKAAQAEVSARRSDAHPQGPTLNQCVYYTYDKNGNRLKQENVSIDGASGTWGSSKYLCFIWGS